MASECIVRSSAEMEPNGFRSAAYIWNRVPHSWFTVRLTSIVHSAKGTKHTLAINKCKGPDICWITLWNVRIHEPLVLKLVLFLHIFFAALTYILAVSCLTKVEIVNAFFFYFWKCFQKGFFNELPQFLVLLFLIWAVELEHLSFLIRTICRLGFFCFQKMFCSK